MGDNESENSKKITEWKFRLDKVSPNRLHYLEQDLSRLEIAELIANEMSDIRFSPEKGNRAAQGKKRARFYFTVPPETLDVFFNSDQGYRAQYYISPKIGIEYNRDVINMIKSKLVDSIRQTSHVLITIDEVQKSIEFNSAKIWIDEKQSTLNQTSCKEEEILTLEIPRWVAIMREVLAEWNNNQNPIPTVKNRALLGVQMPEGNRLIVLGAWIDDNNNEYVVQSKINRAQEIYEYGFS